MPADQRYDEGDALDTVDGYVTRDEQRRDANADDVEAGIAADLAWDPACPFRREPGHTCLRRDGRSVGVLGEAGDCFVGAQAELYGLSEAMAGVANEGASLAAYHGEVEESRRRHPSAYEPDTAYLLQQSLIDADERAMGRRS